MNEKTIGELTETLVKRFKREATKRFKREANGDIYAHTCGALWGVLEGLPDTEENRIYLAKIVNRK